MKASRTTGTSLMIGVVTSSLLGLVFAIPTYYATEWIWQPLGLALAILVGGFVFKTVLIGGYQAVSVPVNNKGVATRSGDKPTGVLYDEGDHWGFPNISGAINVDLRRRRINLLEKFTASAGDTSDVGIDGFLLVRTVNPESAIKVDDMNESLRELFESRTRFFAAMISKAENAVKFRDLLADYLELEPQRGDDPPPEHTKFQKRLEKLSDYLVKSEIKDGITALMAKDEVGALKRHAEDWGVEIEEVEIEQISIPQAVKDANVKKATQAALMEAEKIRNTARAEMVAELVAMDVNPNTAMNSVDMLLGLSVKKDVQEITITDLKEAAGNLGAPIAVILEQFINRRQSRRQKPQRT